MAKKVKAELVENFLVIWNPEEGSELYGLGFYGKPIGIPKPKSPDFDVPLMLDLMEGVYLAKKGLIEVFEGPNKDKLYDNFDHKFAVYRDLRDKELVVTPGIKFGCDFAVYRRGPGIDHAPFMISVKSRREETTATDIVKAGRLGT
jgi:tRNA-intron endonuclease